MTDWAKERLERIRGQVHTIEREIAEGRDVRGKTLSHQEMSSRRGGLVGMKADLEKHERALILDRLDRIQIRITDCGGTLSDERKSKLATVSLSAIEKTFESVMNTSNPQEQITVVVRAITDHDHAQIEAEKKKFDELDGGQPAKVDMH